MLMCSCQRRGRRKERRKGGLWQIATGCRLLFFGGICWVRTKRLNKEHLLVFMVRGSTIYFPLFNCGRSCFCLSTLLFSSTNLFPYFPLLFPHTGIPQIVSSLQASIQSIRAVNPECTITFTVSPVRHLRNAAGDPGT